MIIIAHDWEKTEQHVLTPLGKTRVQIKWCKVHKTYELIVDDEIYPLPYPLSITKDDEKYVDVCEFPK